MGKENKTETKLAAARTRLILDKPFLGALVLRLPMVEADPQWCRTTATDARTFYYNREYIEQLTLEETQFMLAHEALHCGLSHFARRLHRVKGRWDIACDYAVNPLLINDALTPPPGTLYMQEYDGMTAEEIYPFIDENSEDGPMDQHLYDDSGDQGSDNTRPPPEGSPPRPDKDPRRGDDGKGDTPQGAGGEGQSNQQDRSGQPDPQAGGAPKPPPLTQSEIEQLSVQWQQRLAGAAQQALQAGRLGGSMARLVDHLLQPQLPWRTLLARYMNTAARDDYSFTRPSTRREGPAILPSLHSTQIEVAVVLDTSGSISDEEMHEFLAEVDALKGQLRARITLHACDEELAEDGPWVYEPWEELTLPEELHGGGGTRFTPAIEWAERLERQPDMFLYFTDADGEFPDHEPAFPVIWLVKGKTTVPWGQRIQLN